MKAITNACKCRVFFFFSFSKLTLTVTEMFDRNCRMFSQIPEQIIRSRVSTLFPHQYCDSVRDLVVVLRRETWRHPGESVLHSMTSLFISITHLHDVVDECEQRSKWKGSNEESDKAELDYCKQTSLPPFSVFLYSPISRYSSNSHCSYVGDR